MCVCVWGGGSKERGIEKVRCREKEKEEREEWVLLTQNVLMENNDLLLWCLGSQGSEDRVGGRMCGSAG